MNYQETVKAVSFVLAGGDVPLVVGDSGVGKTTLARDVAQNNHWDYIGIDANLLKEGEIGGLPTVQLRSDGKSVTVYAVHHKLQAVEQACRRGGTVLLFIDELNRCEHAVQQELMNLILNREINGYTLPAQVHVMAAMNPGERFEGQYRYQTTEMDPAQENRFVWLFLEPDAAQWLRWGHLQGIHPRILDFIATFPQYLMSGEGDTLQATPRSYERLSHAFHLYDSPEPPVSEQVFLAIAEGNVGKKIAREFIAFIRGKYPPLLHYADLFLPEAFSPSLQEQIKKESLPRLYLMAGQFLPVLQEKWEETGDLLLLKRLTDILSCYPHDLLIRIMQDLRADYPRLYAPLSKDEAFVALFYNAHNLPEKEA